MTPPDTVGSVRSTCVLEGPNHVVKGSLEALTAGERIDLIDALRRAKKACLGVGSPDPTDQEMSRFLSEVFDMWASGEYHSLPDANSLTTGMHDRTVAIGRLTEDVQSRQEEHEEELKKRGVSGKKTTARASKHLKQDYAVTTAAPSRKRGAQVSIRATLKNGSQVSDLHLEIFCYTHWLTPFRSTPNLSRSVATSSRPLSKWNTLRE